MKSQLCLAIVCSLMAGVTLAQEGRVSSRRLDATHARQQEGTSGRGEGHAIAVSGQLPALLPLQLELVSLDRPNYIFGSPAIYEVAIKNIGNEPFGLPWSTVHRSPDPEGNSATVWASLSLVITDSEGREERIASVLLSGSPASPGSIELLPPGETAVIRAQGSTGTADVEFATRVAAAGPSGVKATLMLSTQAQSWERLLSTNSIPTWFTLAQAPH